MLPLCILPGGITLVLNWDSRHPCLQERFMCGVELLHVLKGTERSGGFFIHYKIGELCLCSSSYWENVGLCCLPQSDLGQCFVVMGS